MVNYPLIPKSFFRVISGDKVKIIRRVIYNITIISLQIGAYTLNLYNVVEGLSGDEKQPVIKFLMCTLPSYDRFSKGHSAAEGCNLKNI